MNVYFSEDLIKKAIAKKITECLTVTSGEDSVPPVIFADKIQEGAVEPFFLILVVDVSQTNDLGSRFWRLYQMKVLYYVDESDSDKITQLRVMGERLMGMLDKIDVDYKKENGIYYTRPLKCKKLHYQITENVLNFFCNYKVRVRQELKPNTKMNVLDVRMED